MAAGAIATTAVTAAIAAVVDAMAVTAASAVSAPVSVLRAPAAKHVPMDAVKTALKTALRAVRRVVAIVRSAVIARRARKVHALRASPSARKVKPPLKGRIKAPVLATAAMANVVTGTAAVAGIAVRAVMVSRATHVKAKPTRRQATCNHLPPCQPAAMPPQVWSRITSPADPQVKAHRKRVASARMVAAVVVVAVAVDVVAVIARACRWMAVKQSARLARMASSSWTVKPMPKPALPKVRMHLNRPRLL